MSLDAQGNRCNSGQLTNLLIFKHFAYISIVRILKMKAYSLIFIIIIYCICRYASVEIKPELKNILHFGYRINFKYEGMLANSFNRFYVITKFILPTISDLKFSTINFNESYHYLQKNGCSVEAKKYILDLIVYCKKIIPFVQYYQNKFLLLIALHITS